MSMNRFCHPSTQLHSEEKDGRVPISDHAIVTNGLRRTTTLRVCLVVAFWVAFSAGEKTTSAQAPTKPAKKAAQPADELKIDPDTLPAKWQPPPKPLAIMDLELPIATKEELAKLKKEWQKFSKVKNDCDLSQQGRAVIQASIRYRLAEMTAITPSVMKDKPKELPELHRQIITEISVNNNSVKRPVDVAAMAEAINKEVVKQIPELLRNNFYVRLHAVLILSEMDFAPAYEILLSVVQSKDILEDAVDGQPEAIKIAAVNGLIRILRFAKGPVKDRTTIANAVVEELKKKENYWWFQKRLVESLRYCDIAGVDVGNNNRPFVVDTLISIIKDPERHWRVRAVACYALGRVPLPAAVKPEDVVTTIAGFALDLANAAAADPSNPMWKRCFTDLYLAFKPHDTPKEKDLDAEEKLPGGLLARIKGPSQPAYLVIVPIVNDVLNGKSPEAGNVKKLSDFVQAR